MRAKFYQAVSGFSDRFRPWKKKREEEHRYTVATPGRRNSTLWMVFVAQKVNVGDQLQARGIFSGTVIETSAR